MGIWSVPKKSECHRFIKAYLCPFYRLLLISGVFMNWCKGFILWSFTELYILLSFVKGQIRLNDFIYEFSVVKIKEHGDTSNAL